MVFSINTIESSMNNVFPVNESEYIIDDYLLSGENLKEDLILFAQNHPEIDINVITPKAEYIDRFLEWYQQ
jgi:hypothetical protein